VRPGRGNAADRGQAAVELALVLPLVATVLLAVVQVGLLVRDDVLVVHAAREGARAAAVDPAAGAAAGAAARAGGLDPARLEVVTSGRAGPGSRVRVEVRYRAPTVVPIVGRLMTRRVLRAAATMRVER
jgi:Flp pilus assembly protein TadG